MKISSISQICPNKICETYLSQEQTNNRIINYAQISDCFVKENNCNKEYTKNLRKSRADNIAFTSSIPKLQLKNIAEAILERSIVFGPEEYKNLSAADFSVLRDYQKIFLSDKSINSVLNFVTNFGEIFSERLAEKYPNGFTFVSVGRSPAVLAKYLEFQGKDVLYCPFSNMRVSSLPDFFSFRFIEVYKKYLASIGLTKEMVQNAQKPVIITDYNYKGFSLENFKKLMGLPEIGIYEGEKVKFCPMTACLKFDRENCIFNHDPYGNIAGKTEKWKFDDGFFIDNMEYEKTKWYTGIPYLDACKFGNYEEEILNRYYQNGNKFEENTYTKMMNFLIADNIHKQEIILCR